MTMETFIADWVAKLGINVPDILLVMFGFAIIPLYAQDFRFGVLMHFLTFGVLFVLATSLGMNTTKLLIMVFIMVIVMALGILTSFARGGGTQV